MDEHTPAHEKLRAAAVLIADAMTRLDANTTRCQSCGVTRANDPIEYKAHISLAQTRRKILDWADTLYLPREEREKKAKERKR